MVGHRIVPAVWPDTFVTDDALKYAIVELRKAFDDDARDPQIILTLPRRGYRRLFLYDWGEPIGAGLRLVDDFE